ncbi:putative kinetochore-associated protein NNF1 [Rosellinia necatrix]|uniref:Putative kinetochore-associated protein NNF1 n=1 Tax=Rosellinia necatrix TaxID=77044 RepID=A0A1W2TNS6_ROSNE|nr:putative kinetochore-associated protein NNF1 [Rosellinia necatrix]
MAPEPQATTSNRDAGAQSQGGGGQAAATAPATATATAATEQQQQQQQQQQQSQSESMEGVVVEQEQEQEQEAEEAVPGSSPLPARHTALTPGPRASRFQTTLDAALAHTLAKVSWDNFAACYPHVAAHAPATLRAVQTQMVDRLRSLCKKEFESVQQSRNVVAKLNELEMLVGEADRRRREAGGGGGDDTPPIPPHLLPPEEVLDAHLAPHLAQQQSQLNAKLQTTQAHNARLFEDVTRQRAEIESLVALLQAVVEDIDGTNQMLDGVVDDVARETRAIEVEMAEP